jgi:hemolysin-activating ACP:hemolysin acyltransferase
MALTVRRLGSRMAALGAAAQFVALRQPFAAFPAQHLIATLHGQIAREHYLFALDGQAVRAYLGWAMFDEAVAERVLRTGQAPTLGEAASGDILWILTAAATDRAALLSCVNALRAQRPGGRVMGVRHRTNGRAAVFDGRIRPRRTDAGSSLSSGRS